MKTTKATKATMHPNLSFDQAPPLSVPLRFFLVAPLFGIAAGLWLVWRGEAAWVTRWSADVLALTHLFTVGFMLQVMCGAVFQFVPVAAGGNVWQPRLIAHLVQPALIFGVLGLVAGFISQQAVFFRCAVFVLAGGLLIFLAIVGMALLRTRARGATLQTLRLALAGLAMTLILGVGLAAALGWHSVLPDGAGWTFSRLVNVHAAWGFAGWGLMLVMGVSYFVVPMFQLTPSYPERLSRGLPLILLLCLLLWSLQLSGVEETRLEPDGYPGQMLLLLIYCVVAAYALITLRLQHQRRRRVTDITFRFWQLAMMTLLVLPVLWLAIRLLPGWAEHPRIALGLGVLWIWGGFVSVICGMLYKIVPFLIWLHLQNMGILKLKIVPPNMKQMIPDRMMRAQMMVHLASLALLLAATVWPSLIRLAGLGVACSLVLLEWNLLGALRLYRDFQTRICAQQA